MFNIKDDNLYLLISYLGNKDSLSIVLTCKYYKKFFYKIGFVKYLNVYRSPSELFDKYNNHYRTLLSMTMTNIINPQNWIFGNWCKKVFLINCILTDKIDPTKPCLVEELSIYDSYKNKPIRINLKKFPKLKVLKIDVFDIELLNIESCSNLENVYINVGNKEKKSFLDDFTSLKKINLLLINS